jgi:hypothetical protein
MHAWKNPKAALADTLRAIFHSAQAIERGQPPKFVLTQLKDEFLYPKDKNCERNKL